MTAKDAGARLEQDFAVAANHHMAGRLSEAETMYRRILSREPNHAGALHNLGFLAGQLGNPSEAIRLFDEALAVKPNYAEAYNNKGNALLDIGEQEQAIENFERAVTMKPDYAEALYNKGNALFATRRLAESVVSFEQALAIQPGYTEAHMNMGSALQEQGRVDEAISSFDAALALNPGAPEPHYNKGLAYMELGDFDDAIGSFDQAIALNPDYVAARGNRANALIESRRIDDALRELETAIAIDSGDPLLHNNKGSALLEQGRFEPALASFEMALSIESNNTTALALKSRALIELGRNGELASLVDFDRLIQTQFVDLPEEFETDSDFNGALADYCISHPTLVFARAGKATKNGYQTENLIGGGELGPAQYLLQAIGVAAECYRERHATDPAHPFLARPPSSFSIDIWGTVLERQGHQRAHIHNAGWLSGVYYAKLPDVISSDDTGHAGWIEFGRPLSNPLSQANPEVRLVQPEEGLMVLFPSYFWHRTVPFESDETRVSIAFDLIPA